MVRSVILISAFPSFSKQTFCEAPSGHRNLRLIVVALVVVAFGTGILVKIRESVTSLIDGKYVAVFTVFE